MAKNFTRREFGLYAFRNVSIFSFLTVLLVGSTTVQAALVWNLEDHGGGNQGPNYGLRVDDNGTVNTFSFQQDGAAVTLAIDVTAPGQNRALISGVVRHNQSGQLWCISAALEAHLFTADNDPVDWRTDLSGDLYDGMIEDLINNGTNVHGLGHLKNLSLDADRIGFNVITVNMTLKPDQGDPTFTLSSDNDGDYLLYDFPQGDDVVPFLLAKGHRLGEASNEIAGIGWLDPRHPDAQVGSDGNTQDFLFRLGSPVNETMPEPHSAIVWILLAGLGLSRNRGRRRFGGLGSAV